MSDPLKQQDSPAESSGAAPQLGGWTSANTLLLVAGIMALLLGFIDLSYVDAMAENIHGILSPILILGGYVIIFFSIILHKSKPDH
ncbi:hypothetical protein JXA32_11385 [Candidatus Sumerlaeota bacterium]|nr:hypothetical protein [Candidatus Sumerlaeota bacterium]